ncbi:MAG TPA: CBS domain-containing protein [Ideonella sp.]|uniref:CBS domain-containing protein n=1 Tax=Ideonella sp. TaxID=1929293 RepID=UPI002E31FFA0|nr:CBS domain-containing protein [Ideonella sp.]HEX5685024.1 CBS domain-containing protein [Ideonella sp.]
MSARTLTAGDVCTRIVAISFRSVRLAEAAQTMRDQQVGCLVVVEESDPGRTVVGILTDRDIVVSVLAKDQDARYMVVSQAMTADVVTAREEDSVLDVLELMRRKGVRRVPVTGPQAVLVGIVTLDDLLEVVSQEMQALAGAIGSGRARERAAHA